MLSNGEMVLWLELLLHSLVDKAHIIFFAGAAFWGSLRQNKLFPHLWCQSALYACIALMTLE